MDIAASRLAGILAVSALLAWPARADEAELPTGAALLVKDPLDETTFAEHWTKAKGSFAIEDGVFTAREIPAENHHAGAGRIESVLNGILEVEFKLVESDEVQFRNLKLWDLAKTPADEWAKRFRKAQR